MNALNYLNKLIEQGKEFPDAEFCVSQKYGIDCDELRADYDRQFA